MVQIRELSDKERQYIRSITKLHTCAFPSFFLTQLGTLFLRTLYEGYLEDSNSGIIIAENSESILGFAAYSKNYSLFYKRLIRTHLFQFAFCSFCAIIRHPTFTKRLLGAFKKSEEVKKEVTYVELASICVSPDIKGKGVGSMLIEKLKQITDFTSYSYINLETDAYDNDFANEFYIKNGFKLFRSYFTREGRKMNEYRFYAKVE